MTKYISYSTVSQFHNCHKAVALKLAKAKFYSSQSMLIGSAIHAGLKVFFLGGSIFEAIEQSKQYVITFGNIDKLDESWPDKTIDDFRLTESIEDIANHVTGATEDAILAWKMPSGFEVLVGKNNETGDEVVEVEQVKLYALNVNIVDQYGETEEREFYIKFIPDIILVNHKSKTVIIVDHKTAKTNSATIPDTTKLQLANEANFYYESGLQKYKFYGMKNLIVWKKNTTQEKKGLPRTNRQLFFKIPRDLMTFAVEQFSEVAKEIALMDETDIASCGGPMSTFGCGGCSYNQECSTYGIIKDAVNVEINEVIDEIHT